jgi:hypothetical protein
MYSALWFWTVGTMWLSLRLRGQGFRPAVFLVWVAVGTAGHLTHFFYAFVWVAALAWLWLHPGRLARKFVWTGAVLVALLIAPWYLRLPEQLAQWRVTGSWLNAPPPRYNFVIKLLQMPWSYFSIRGEWGGSRWADCLNLALFGVLAVAIGKTLWRSAFQPRRCLLWFWLLGACLGPVLFDLLRGTYAMTIPRYAIAGMPAAFLLAGFGLARLVRLLRVTFLALILAAFLLGLFQMYLNPFRNLEPYREVGQRLAEQAADGDLVIVHSIPSGVAGAARYMERSGISHPEVGFVSWVGQLKQRRVPEDVERLAAGRKRIFLLKIHEVGEPAPEEAWLQENATLAAEEHLGLAMIWQFVPRRGEVFFFGARAGNEAFTAAAGSKTRLLCRTGQQRETAHRQSHPLPASAETTSDRCRRPRSAPATRVPRS